MKTHLKLKIINITIIALTLILSGNSCKNFRSNSSIFTELEKERKKHLIPQDSVVNLIKIGKTIAFESSLVKGINRDEYPEPEYWKEIDSNFFQKIETKDYNDPQEDGGSSYSLEIFKAVKKGITEIKFYKKEIINANENSDDTIETNQKDTTILYNTYKFKIE